jgi:hypothetical protein
MDSIQINTQQACEILGISNDNIDKNSIKKAYIKAALRTHPDKNHDKTSTEIFIRVNAAYQHLNNNISNKQSSNKYNGFISKIIELTGLKVWNELSVELLNNLKTQISNLIIHEFKNINRHEALELYNYVFNFKDILHIDDHTIIQIKKIIKEKHEKVHDIILRPELSQLFEPELFPITYKGENYFVPLWHEEVEFDLKDKYLIVKIIPTLPDNIIIDNNGSINIFLHTNCRQLLEEKHIDVIIGNKKLTINCKDISFQKFQTINIKNKGIVILNHNNILDGSNRGDVIVHLIIKI